MNTPRSENQPQHRIPQLALPAALSAVAPDGSVSWTKDHTPPAILEHRGILRGPVPQQRSQEKTTDTANLGAVDSGETTGLLIGGEAAAALRTLSMGTVPIPGLAKGTGLTGQVQTVYIDPPYNTGGNFVDYSDHVDHELWLVMMRERLQLLRETLRDSGSLWLHVDDSEMAYAKVLCDEVFGRENLVSAIVIENNPKGRQLGKFFAGSHDHLLCYARDIEKVRIVPGVREAVNPADFPKTDALGAYRYLPLRNTNKKFHPGTAPTMYYPLWAHPESGAVAADEFPGAQQVWPVFGDGTPAVWRWSAPRVRERATELIARTVRGRGGAGSRLDVFQIDRLTKERTKKLRSIWLASEIGSSDSAKAELKKVLPGRTIFATPKPEPLLRRVIEASSAPGDLVLDCFAGSGTTAAVAQRLGRRWVAVELSAATVGAHLLPRIENELLRSPGNVDVWSTRVFAGREGKDSAVQVEDD